MKQTFAFLLWLAAATLYAQNSNEKASDPQPAIIEFNGGKYNGHVMELNSPPDIVEEEVKEKFKAQGVKPKKIDDFLVYRNVLLRQVDPSKPMDAFVKIERKSKKESDKTIAYFIVTYPGEIPDDKVKSGETAVAIGVTTVVGGDAVMKGMTPSVDQRVYDKSMLEKQDALKKEEKKMEDLKKEQTDLEKKIKQLQTDLETNAKAQSQQATTVGKAKSDVNDLLSKKPGGGR